MKNSLRSFFFGTALNDQDKLHNLGWLLFRMHIGLSIAIHAGWPKINGSSTPEWFIKQVGEIGFSFPTPEFWAMAATWGEFAGGLLLAAGFLTRFAALQLAFQFFVISFLWYENPEPFTGMYFQQLLFWCYVLAVFIGGGKYSVDSYIRQPRPTRSPMPKVALMVMATLVTTLLSFAQSRPLQGNGKIVKTAYAFSDFDKVDLLDLDGNIKIEVGKPFAIRIETDANLATLMSVSKAGGTLEVKVLDNENNRRYLEKTNILVIIAMPRISALNHTGNSDVRVHGITGKSFRLTNNGNGDVLLEGSISDLEIIKDGNGDTDASQVSAEKVNINTSGNGDVKVRASLSWFASGSGNGDVTNFGSGKLRPGSLLSGNGKIKTLNNR